MGLVNVDLEAVVCHSDALGIEALLPLIDPELVMHLAEQGMFSEEEVGSIIASRERFLNAPDPLILIQGLMACSETTILGQLSMLLSRRVPSCRVRLLNALRNFIPALLALHLLTT